MNSRTLLFSLALILTLPIWHRSDCLAQGKYEPDDPIASVNGNPVFLGELNLVLVDRLRIRDLSKTPMNVQQATTTLLLRQHLALLSLREIGGQSLDQMINRQVSQFAAETKRQGSSLEKYAAKRKSNAKSMENSLAFQVAWRQYLKSQLTPKNLQRYFEQNRKKYAGGSWDVSQLFLEIDPRDASSAEVAELRMNKLIKEIRESSTSESAFATAVRENSDAPSASKGGRLGWVESDGDLPSSVMKIVRGTPVGTVSQPARSPLGLHAVFIHDTKTRDLKFQDLTDQSQLRRDATDALFHRLVRRQKDAKIAWYISGLKPPAGTKIIPD